MNNILMLTPYLPYPPISGGRSRTYNLIKELRRIYKITLVCFGRPEEREHDITPLIELCETFVIDRASSPSKLQAAFLSLSSIKPITMRLYASAEFQDTVAGLLKERHFDLVHVESFYMMQNVPHNVPVPILLAEPAIEYLAWARFASVAQPVYQRPALALESLKMRIFEPQVWGQATCVGVMSDYDAQVVKKATPGVATTPSPNGVDVEYFKPALIARDEDVAVFMGDYKYFPNVDAVMYFVREIMPIISKERRNFSLILLGKDAPPELMELSNNPDSGVRVAGLVEDTRPYLHSASLFICPLRIGSGTRFKLLEALACGCPVVSTTLGAEGLNPVHDRHMLLADTPQDFAEAVIALLNHPEEALRLGRHGRNWVVERYAWRRCAGLLADAYDRLIGSDDRTVRRDITV